MPVANQQARLLTCIGEPTRLQILKLLMDGEKYVTEIVEALKIEQSLVSYHLKHLKQCNIVKSRQEAQRTYYGLSDGRLGELVMISEALVRDIAVCSADEDSGKAGTSTGEGNQLDGAKVTYPTG